MSEERKEYPFDVKFDESALKTFNDLIKEKGIRHFKLESDLYGILDVVSYEEYEKLQQKVEQLEKEVNEYQKELEKADSITQSCIFQGKQESKISFRKCLNRLEQLENIRKEAIKATKDVKQFVYDELVDRNVSGATETHCKIMNLLNILNKGE